MRFGYTIAYVRNVGETVEFWERAFGLKRRFVSENNDYGEMETGETTLSFASNERGEANLLGGFRKNSLEGLPAGVAIALVTEDVEMAFRSALEAGAREVAKPKSKPWGQTVGYVRDPEGVLVEIGSEV
jgi:lactoylglutathione lyase